MAARITIFIIGFTSFVVAFAHERYPDFSYKGPTGPDRWGSLSPDYEICSNGKFQSPINIMKGDCFVDQKLETLVSDCSPANATLVDNRFNMAVRWEKDGGVMTMQGQNYTLKQLHWHSPSEHTINLIRHPMELHFVYQSDSGSLTVVAMLYKFGEPDPFLNQLKSYMDMLAQKSCEGHEVAQVPIGILDLKEIKSTFKKYYRYMGSLTVPPCTENVTWTVLAKVRELSLLQLGALKAPLDSLCKNNARPIQQLNGRKVSLSKEDGDD